MLELYKNIRLRRKALGMTQEELASKTGYTNKSSIATIEAGKTNIPLSKVIDFAKALECTASELMGVEGSYVDVNLTFEETVLIGIVRDHPEKISDVIEYAKFITKDL